MPKVITDCAEFLRDTEPAREMFEWVKQREGIWCFLQCVTQPEQGEHVATFVRAADKDLVPLTLSVVATQTPSGKWRLRLRHTSKAK